MSDDNRFQLIKTYKERQDRFIYYITSLNVASIGFTVSKSYEIIPNHSHDLILGGAIFAWVVSTVASFRWMYIQNRIMETNLEMYDLSKGNYTSKKMDEVSKLNRINDCKILLEKDNAKCEKAINFTIRFFIIGMVTFLFWRVQDII